MFIRIQRYKCIESKMEDPKVYYCAERKLLCSQFTMYFITGYRLGSESRNKEVAYETLQSWFKLDPRHFQEILNDSLDIRAAYQLLTKSRSDQLMDTASKSVTQNILKAITRKEARCACQKITSVFITHSHGAVCLKAALYNPGIAPDQLRKILQQTAIISIGGLIQLSDEVNVKILMNFCFKNDKVINKMKEMSSNVEEHSSIKLGPFTRTDEDNYSCKCCVETEKNERDGVLAIDEQPNTQVKDASKKSQEITSKQNEADEQTDITSGTSLFKIFAKRKTDNAHFITDYILCKTLKNKIQERFKMEP